MGLKSISLVQTLSKDTNQLQQNIKQAVDPLLANPMTQGNIINGVALKIGSNSINTGLGAALQGWQIIGKNGPAGIYDNQTNNPSPSNTLILISDAAVTVNIYVF